MRIRTRLAEGAEIDASGPSSQLIVHFDIEGIPLTCEQQVCIDRETDLMLKELVPDCKVIGGTTGGAEQLMSSYYYWVMRPALLPISFEACLTREFSVCREPPLKGYPAGVLCVESSVPPGLREYEGWQIPGTSWTYVRMANYCVKYFEDDANHPGCVKLTQVSNFGASVPRRVAPLGLINNLIFGIIHKFNKTLKKSVIDVWSSSDYQARIESEPHFYGSISALGSRAA